MLLPAYHDCQAAEETGKIFTTQEAGIDGDNTSTDDDVFEDVSRTRSNQDNETQFRTKPHSVTLSQSKTTIVSIAGVPAGKIIDADQECYCAACLKWKDLDLNQDNKPRKFVVDVPQNSRQPEESEMIAVYATLGQEKASTRFKNKSGYSVRPGLKGYRQPNRKVSIKRFD